MRLGSVWYIEAVGYHEVVFGPGAWKRVFSAAGQNQKIISNKKFTILAFIQCRPRQYVRSVPSLLMATSSVLSFKRLISSPSSRMGSNLFVNATLWVVVDRRCRFTHVYRLEERQF